MTLTQRIPLHYDKSGVKLTLRFIHLWTSSVKSSSHGIKPWHLSYTSQYYQQESSFTEILSSSERQDTITVNRHLKLGYYAEEPRTHHTEYQSYFSIQQKFPLESRKRRVMGSPCDELKPVDTPLNMCYTWFVRRAGFNTGILLQVHILCYVKDSLIYVRHKISAVIKAGTCLIAVYTNLHHSHWTTDGYIAGEMLHKRWKPGVGRVLP